MPNHQKPPLLILHGFRGNHLGFTEVAKKLEATGYKVYIPDLPPAGNYDLPAYTANAYAQFVADYIKKQNLDHPVLIGHSMGSIIAAATARKFPKLINDRLILLSPISNKPARFFASLTPLTTLLPNKAIGYISTKYLYVPKSQANLKSILKTTYLCGADCVSKKAGFSSAKFSATHSIADFLPAPGNFQITLISGEHDRLIPKKQTDALARRLNAKNIYLKNSGHLINYEKPAELSETILQILAQ